jgi:hypothetical protein
MAYICNILYRRSHIHKSQCNRLQPHKKKHCLRRKIGNKPLVTNMACKKLTIWTFWWKCSLKLLLDTKKMQTLPSFQSKMQKCSSWCWWVWQRANSSSHWMAVEAQVAAAIQSTYDTNTNKHILKTESSQVKITILRQGPSQVRLLNIWTCSKMTLCLSCQ